MPTDFAGRQIKTRFYKIEPVVKAANKPVVQSESDFDNYDRAIDESPMHIMGYRPEWDMDSREKQVRRIR